MKSDLLWEKHICTYSGPAGWALLRFTGHSVATYVLPPQKEPPGLGWSEALLTWFMSSHFCPWFTCAWEFNTYLGDTFSHGWNTMMLVLLKIWKITFKSDKHFVWMGYVTTELNTFEWHFSLREKHLLAQISFVRQSFGEPTMSKKYLIPSSKSLWSTHFSKLTPLIWIMFDIIHVRPDTWRPFLW